MTERHLDWEGLHNARDLGGLPTDGGRATVRGAVVRSEAPDRLTPAGLRSLREHGIRTIVDLRNDDERADALRDAGARVVHVPLEDVADPEFWDGLERGASGTPLYYEAFLARYPQRVAAALRAVAAAEPGGVLIHCASGRDRTGLVSLLLLSLAGVPPETIAEDYALTAERLRSLYALLGTADQGPRIAEFLAARGSTTYEAALAVARAVDAEAYLLSAGLTPAELGALRDRLLEGS